MRDLCDRYSRDTDYYVKSTPEKPNTYSYSFALQYLAFFSVRFDFEYDRSIYQKMLLSDPGLFYSGDEHNEFPGYLKKHLAGGLKSAVINNLPLIDPYCSCVRVYLEYCRKQGLEDAVALADAVCQTEGLLSTEKREAVQYLYEICGREYLFQHHLETADPELLSQIVQVTRNSKDERLIKRLLKENEKSENGLIYLRDLIFMGSHEGVVRYISLCKKNNSIPDYTEDDSISELTESISTLHAADFLAELAEMRKLVFSSGFCDQKSFGLSNSVYKAYKNVEEDKLVQVKEELIHVAEESTSDEEKRYCNAILSDLSGIEEQQQDTPWTIREIKSFWKRVSS